jgi:purine catabolism regulator
MKQRQKLTLGELAATAHLELEVIAGEAGLDRVVEWTHISELEDPAPWIDGGELLIVNGFGLGSSGDEQAKFVDRLHEKRAVGLAIGQRAPELTEMMIATADRLKFPLLRVPREVPFLAISRLVADANEDTARRRLTTHLRIFDTLRADPQTPQDLFETLETISGYNLYLVSASGQPLLPGLPPTTELVMEMLDSHATTEPGQLLTAGGGHVVPVPVGHRTAAFVVAVEREGDDPAGLGAVRHIATLAALELAKLYREREALRRQGSESLAKLFSGSLDAAAAEEHLQAAGFEPRAAFVVAAMRGGVEPIDDEEVHHLLCDLGVPHLLLSERDNLFVALPNDPAPISVIAEDAEIGAGVSQPYVGISNWSLARKEAMWALELSRFEGDSKAGVVQFSAADAIVHWLPADVAALEELVERVLGAVLAYDDEHSAGMLLESLRVYFDNNRKLKVSADELHIHKHTLSYRLRRIEEISERDLSEMGDLVQLWLALRAHTIIGRAAPAANDLDHAHA